VNYKNNSNVALQSAIQKYGLVAALLRTNLSFVFLSTFLMKVRLLVIRV